VPHERMNRSVAAILVVGLPLAGCRCADPMVYQEALEPTESASEESTSTDLSTSDTDPTSESTDEPVDVSRFMGIFHNEFELMPFGREVPNIGDPTISNLEILPDGTASMTMETCSEYFGTREIALRWEARPGPALEFFPGPGEDSLRFMAVTDLESVRATLGDGCDLLFELDGQALWAEVYRPGRACWVNRCMPAWTVHIDYCEGEEPPLCE
jgi:hypothetical protein